VRPALEAAFANLFSNVEMLPGKDEILRECIDELVDLEIGLSAERPADTEWPAMMSELRKIGKHASKLVDEIAAMSLRAAERIELLGGFTQVDRSRLLADLTDFAAKARNAGTEPVEDSKKPQNERAHYVTSVLLWDAFEALTGKRPTVATHSGDELEGEAYGPYLTLVCDVFGVMTCLGDPKPEHYARYAIKWHRRIDQLR
jgi:hypothetical protein